MKKLSLLFLLLVISCSKKEKVVSFEEDVATSYHSILYTNEPYMDSLREVVLKNGNAEDYEKLYNICEHSGKKGEHFYFSLIMAEKYNYAKAYYYYLYINMRYKDNKNTDKLAVYYLLKAYEGNCEDAKYGIGEIFKNKQIPKSEDYLCIKDTTKLVEIPIM